jgi:hypothetical protein
MPVLLLVFDRQDGQRVLDLLAAVDCQPMSRWSMPAISMTGRRPGVTSRGSDAHPAGRTPPS